MINSYQSLIKNKLVTFTYRGNSKLPAFKDVTSVAVLPFTTDGHMVIVDLYQRGLDLPGGHVEPYETTPIQTMTREIMEEASITIKAPVLVEVVESNYFEDRVSYMLIYGAFVDRYFEFVPNSESRERVIITKKDFIERYKGNDKILMEKVIDDAWTLLGKDLRTSTRSMQNI